MEVEEATQKWESIPDFSGYQVSDQGKVRNKNGRLLRQHIATRHVGFYVNLKNTTRLVHTLVLSAFRGPSQARITHRNGNKLDNRLSNLCYGESGHSSVGKRCSKGHELTLNNVKLWGSNRICLPCGEGKPAVRELPEWI